MWSWCKQWFSGASRTPRPPARKKRCGLQVESLEERTTPAPVSGGPAFETGASPFANEGATFTGAITPNIFPPVIVNSLDQSLLQMQASSTFGVPAGLSFFPAFELLLQQNPSLNTSVAQGVPSLQSLPLFFPGASFSPFGNVLQVLELPTSTLLPPAHERILVLTIIPNSLRSPLSPFTSQSSGTVLPGQGFNGVFPNGVGIPGTPLTGPLMFRATPSGTNNGGSVSGVVFRDLDASGTHEAREPGIPGVRVILETQRAGTFQFISSTLTDRNGRYAFPGLSAGNYRVRVEAPSGLRAESEGQSVEIAPSAHPTSHDFGLVPKKGQSRPAANEPQAAAPQTPRLLDQVFAAWGGQELSDVALMDRVFAEAVAEPASSPELPPPAILGEGGNDRFAGDESIFAEAGLLVGAVAAVAEFQFRPDATRDWEQRDRFGDAR